MNPADLLYAKTHEWTRVEPAGGGKVATVGITKFAVEALTDLVYMQLPQVGQKVTAGVPMGEIESVKAVSELFAPMSGEVVEVNPSLKDHPEVINSKPHETWMVKVRVSDSKEAGSLLDSAQYDALTHS